MSTRPTATNPSAAPLLTPRTSGWAIFTASTALEAALELELGDVLLLAAVGQEHVHAGAAEPRARVVHVRVGVGRVALAGVGAHEVRPVEVASRRLQQLGQQLLRAPQRITDVVTVLPVHL